MHNRSITKMMTIKKEHINVMIYEKKVYQIVKSDENAKRVKIISFFTIIDVNERKGNKSDFSRGMIKTYKFKVC